MTFPLLLALAASAAPAQAAPAPAGLDAIDFLVGYCWRGELPGGAADTHCFEPVYGGRHVRDRHEVTGAGSVYAGETFYSADGADGLAFHYFNSLGGVSRGTFRRGAGGVQAAEERYRGPDGAETVMTVSWRPVGADAYEVATVSASAPEMNGTIVYRRIAAPVSVSESRALDGTLLLAHEAVVDAPVAEVWNALATAEGWKSWAVPVAWQSPDDPDVIETAYDPAALPGGPQTIGQRVLARIPGRMIAFRTIKAPEGFPHFEIFSRTTGVFELEPLGEERTRVRVTGAGYPDSDAGRQLVGFFREGNRILLERLQHRFTDGPVDWTKIEPTKRD